MEGNRALGSRRAGEGGGRASEKGGDGELHCSDRFGWWIKVSEVNVALPSFIKRSRSAIFRLFELNLSCSSVEMM